jgi:lipoprotein-anchoring transpeptidase ErfK/SrfK
MTSRIATALLLTLLLALSARVAGAQFMPPPPPPGVYALPPDAIPDDDDDDVVAVPRIQSQPLLPPPGAPVTAAAPSRQPQIYDPGAPDPRFQPPAPIQPGPGAPVELTAPQAAPPSGTPVARAPYGAPPAYATTPVARAPAALPSQGAAPSGLRPPAGIEESTGSVPGYGPPTTQGIATPGASPRNTIAALPPEDQPEDAAQVKELPPHLKRQEVEYWTKEPAGTVIIDTPNTYLYYVLGDGRAIRYGVGVGREGFTWTGKERISKMAEWPDWFPPAEMIERQPYLPRFMAGGESNPLGARALYLGKTLYRIHGTNQPSTIGSFVSSGCIRLVNADIEDLYQRVKVGTRVVVLPGNPPVAPTAAATPVPAAQQR